MQKETNASSVNYNDLEMAFDFSSDSNIYDSYAYVCRKSGKIYYVSDGIDDEEDLPDDIGDDDLYAQVPNKYDLNLGKSLVLKFAARSLADNYKKVEFIFRRRGAYNRFKGFLSECEKLDEWYRFEQDATEKALCEWAEYEGFSIARGIEEDTHGL